MLGLILKFRSSFHLKHSKYVPAYQLTLKEYTHDSKARLIHLETDDPNQTFATLFRCEPDSDKGTPHILEHMICCGSEKYPVKDPFMQMCKRSLNSYFNAWTGQDFICFPFASLNQKDFNNLLDVTLDMVFRAKLDLADFYQEGIRLDMENGKYEFKGVVYNEMKGAMQNAQSVFEQYIFQHLMHGTIYQYNSGGEPKEIPKLQYQEIRDLYQKVFSPQNAIFYHYGKEPNFTLIEDYLGQAKSKHAIKHVHQVPNPQNPPEILPLPYQPGENESFLSISYLIEQKDNIKYLALELIQLILFNEQSGLLFSILEDNLAEQFTRSHGTEQSGNYFVFNIGFQGVKKNRQNQIAIEERVFKVLEMLKDKIPQDVIDSSLHQLEVQIKQPYHDQGIKILETLINPLLNNQKIETYLQVDKSFKELRKKVEAGYLSQIIKEEFVQPKIFFAQPDKHYLKDQLNHEKHLLSEIKDKKVQQASKEVFDSNILPTLQISDIQKKIDWTRFNNFEYKGVQCFETIQKTNGITYFKFQFNLGMISDQTRQYIDMFCHLINKFGTNQLSHSELRLLINQYTIGFECTYDCLDKINTYINISIASFNRNIEKALGILAQLLTDIKLNDRKHFSTLLRNNQSDLQNDLIKEQTKYATQSSNSTISYQFSITDINFHTKFQLNYATNYLKVDGMKKSLYIDDFEFQITNILQLCMNKNNMKVIIHHDNQNFEAKPLEHFINSIINHYKAFNQDPFDDFAQEFTPQFQNQFVKLPTQVNSNSRSYKIPYFGHEDLPSLVVLSDVLLNDYLFREIREKGGAYGVGCKVRPFKGVLNLCSSQDPNILKTFSVFDEMNLKSFTQQQLDEAKLTVFQAFDAPLEPQNKGTEFLRLNLTEDQINQYREQLLSVTQQDIHRVFEQYIKNQNFSQTTSASEEHPDIKLLENDDQWKQYKF